MHTPKQGLDGKSRRELRRLHNALKRVVTSGEFISAAQKAHNDLQSRSELKAGAKPYFAKHGQIVPDEVEMELVSRGASQALKISVNGKSLGVAIEMWSKEESLSTERGAVASFTNSVRESSRVVMSDEVLDAIAEARADETARRKFKADPKGHLRKRGVAVPNEVRVDVTEKANPCFYFQWKVCNDWGCCHDQFVWLCW